MSTKSGCISKPRSGFCRPIRQQIKCRLRRIIFFLLRYTGLAALFRIIFQRKKVTILLFHDLDAKMAEKAFSYYRKHYHLIKLESFVAALKSEAESQLPRNALIITFDDGHIGNFDLLPSIIKHRAPVTIYLCASIVDTHRHFWFLHRPLSVSVEKLKRLPNRKRQLALKEMGFDETKAFAKPQALQAVHVEAMRGAIDFQAHTHFHPILPACDEAEATFEIEGGKTALENQFDLEINSIAFPNGDYSKRDIELVKRAGYTSSLTVDFGFNDMKSDPFLLKRIAINDTLDINELIVKSTGLWSFLKTRNGRKQVCGLIPVMKEDSMMV